MSKRVQNDQHYQTAPMRGDPVCAMYGPCARDFRPWVLAATIIGSSMVIDSTVVNVALPVLQAELNATAAQVQWIVESYAPFSLP